ncbi:STAS domain-containing protein [Candidatus Ferrigenium straubiae]|uniref:STAS domain-containing protein n=1 Tax=Candidatus Ferrigenium straubiae TaxID=2919506 RepID=UPI003F4AD672
MIAREDGRLVVRGRLTIATVPALFEAGLQHLASEDMLVDFSQVEAVDSAAVSMLLGWLRAAQRSQRTLRVTGLPEDLLSLARLYGVADLLPQQSA